MQAFITRPALFLCTLLCLLAGASFAGDMYTISDINVIAKGTSALEAKNNGYANAEAQAYRQLLERITPAGTDHRWPDLSPEEISDLVQGFDIQHEKVTPQHYEATINISFNRSMVERLLQKSGISFVGTSSNPVIVLPVLVSNNTASLWELSSPWRTAWATAAKSSYSPIAIPAGSPDERSAVNLDAISKGAYPLGDAEQNNLSALLQKFHAKKILLVKATPTVAEDGKTSLVMQTAYLNGSDPAAATQTFQGDTMEAAMGQAITAAIGQIASAGKQRQLNATSGNSISLNIPLNSLAEWNNLKRRLENMEFVDKIDTRYITIKYALVDLYFQGDYGSIQEKLAGQGLYLDTKQNGIFLRTDAKPATLNSQGRIGNEF